MYAIKTMVGFVPSEVNYYEDMTAKELLEYSARFYHVPLNQHFYRLTEMLELDLTRKIIDLSMGNKKKVAVIQSLIHQPRLLILDEPTTGLDPLMQNRYFELLKEANKNGATIFFSSHILGEVEKLCHRVAIIKDGTVINVDDIRSLKEKLLSRVTFRLKAGAEVISLQIPGIVSDWNFKIASMAVLHTYGVFMCIFFGVLGFFITVLMKRAKANVGIGIGIVLGSYLFDMTVRISDRVQFLLYLTPFKYVDLDVLSEDYGFEGWRLLFFFGASGLLILFSYLVYRKKDILI